MELDLEDLLCAARDGEPSAWERLAPALDRRLNSYFRRMFGEADAKDLTQTTIEVIVRKLPNFMPNKTLLAWVIGIARNKARERLRKRYTARDHQAVLARVDPTANTSPVSQLHKQELLELLREEIEQMPSYYRRAIEIEMEGRSIKTHARRENISATAAGVRRHRAHKWLRKRIDARQQPASPNVLPASTPTLG